jgi:hypothetical protein
MIVKSDYGPIGGRLKCKQDPPAAGLEAEYASGLFLQKTHFVSRHAI